MALGADVLLIATLILWQAGTPWLAAALAAPLLAPLPGIWRGRAYTYAWTSLLVLVYMAFLITEFWVSPDRGYAGTALFAAATLFIACLMSVKSQ
jgi:uncharacterized membrane protein